MQPADQSMITDAHRSRLLPYAALMYPSSKAGNVVLQVTLAADIRADEQPVRPKGASAHGPDGDGDLSSG
jgi:hypothetical protein